MERVILNKIESIERCVKRIDEIYSEDKIEDFLYQDALILNIQRACQQSIDLAMYICSKLAFGIPKSSKEAFELLNKNNVIGKKLSESMVKMVGFRNIAIHEYQNLELGVIKYISEKGKEDFLKYTMEIIGYLKEQF